MSLPRTLVAASVVTLASLTVGCGAGDDAAPSTKETASAPLTMSAEPTESAPASEPSDGPRVGPAAVASDAVRAIAEQDGETYCGLFEVNGKPATPEDVEKCAGAAKSAMTDHLVVLAEAALGAGPDNIEEFGDRAVVTYKGFDPETIDLVKIDGAWYATNN